MFYWLSLTMRGKSTPFTFGEFGSIRDSPSLNNRGINRQPPEFHRVKKDNRQYQVRQQELK